MDGPFDVVMLSRIQFGLTIAFHYIFPPLSIGLGLLMVIMEGLYLRTRMPVYEQMTRFWTRIFAVNFAMGVATGIVMEFQFGTNWSTYSRFVGDVFGSALAAEGIFAFFLESGFLAVLVFGWDRVSARMHFVSTVMVALGATFSAVWIIVANSWQQTPTGHHLVTIDGFTRAEVVDFWAMVFNPSSMPRLIHVLLAAYVLAAFFVMSISAWYLLAGRHREVAQRSLRIALGVGLAAAIMIPFSGHEQAIVVAEHQPAKMASYEGIFRTSQHGEDFYLFGILNREDERIDYGVKIPGMLSWMISGDATKPVPGLDRFRPEDRPPLLPTFYSYHLMVAIGIAVLGLAMLATLFAWRGRLFETRWLLWIIVFAVVLPYAANQLGWFAAEVGRQPWIVYGLLRTEDGVSRAVPGEQVLGSIIMFGVIYVLLFAVWIFVLHNKIAHGPDELHSADAHPDLIDAASALADRSGGSMTEARRGNVEPRQET